MKIYEPLPADGRRLAWNRIDGAGFETIDLRWDNEAWTITASLPERRADYVIRASPFWQPRQFLLFRDLEQPDLWLGTDGNRRWGEVNGAHRPDLDSMSGVFVDDSLLSLALPILSLRLDVGEEAEIPLAHVDTTTLGVTPTLWRFERVGSHRWVIEYVDTLWNDGDVSGAPGSPEPGEADCREPGEADSPKPGEAGHEGTAPDRSEPGHDPTESLAIDQLPKRYEFDVDEFGIPLDVDGHCVRQSD